MTSYVSVMPSQTIQEVVDAIDNASSTNPYVVQLGIGTYDERVVLKPYVSLMGMGRGISVIRPTTAGATSNVVSMATGCKLKNLSAVCYDADISGGSTYDCGYAIGCVTGGASTVLLEDCYFYSDKKTLTSLYGATVKVVTGWTIRDCVVEGSCVGVSICGTYTMWTTSVSIDNSTTAVAHDVYGISPAAGASATALTMYNCAVSVLTGEAANTATGVTITASGSVLAYGCTVRSSNSSSGNAYGLDNGGTTGAMTMIGGSCIATSSLGTAYDMKQATAGSVTADHTYFTSASGTVTQVNCGVKVAHIADAATQTLTGSDTVDITKTTADLTSCKTAINAIIDALEAKGILATS